MTKIIRKTLKITGYIIAGIFLFLVLVYILIQVPAVQDFARKKAVAYLNNKLKTKVDIGRLRIYFPKRIVLENVYFEDRNKDTLLYGKSLQVDISLFKLIKKEVDVQYVELDGIKSHIYRNAPDSVFNYNYIMNAFSSVPEKTPEPKDTTGGFKITVGRVVLKDILATFKDDVSGNDVYFNLGNFDTKISKIDLDKSAYHIPSITVNNIDARIHQYKPLVTVVNNAVNVADSSASPSLQLDEADFKNIKFNYKNDVSAILADINLGDLITHPDLIDLSTLHVRLKDLALNNTKAKVVMGNPEEVKAAADKVQQKIDTATAGNWHIELVKTDMQNNEVIYDDNTMKPIKTGMDYSHLNMQGLAMQADSLSFTPSEYKGNINQIVFKEKSGFNLKKFQSKFLYNEKGAYLQNLVFQTDKSLIKNRIAVRYPSITEVVKKPGELFVDADVTGSYLSMKDVMTFAPFLAANVKGNEQSVFKINAVVKGFVKDLSIPVFDVSGLNNTVVKLSGTIKGLPDGKKALYAINVQNFQTSKKDILQLVPAKTIPNNIRIPNQLSANGFFKGTMKQFTSQLQLNSSNGSAFVKGGLSGKENYVADISLKNLDLGYLLKQEKNVGKITLKAHAKGSGFDAKKANAVFDATVINAAVRGYNYKNLMLNGSIVDGVAKVVSNIKDSNIAFNMNATADMHQTWPAVQLDLLLDTLNLHALHLIADTINLHGHIVANMPVTNPDSLVGNLQLNDLTVFTAGKNIHTDSIALVASANGLQKQLQFSSELLKADLNGEYKLTELGLALEHTINQYYKIAGFKDTTFTAQNWQLNATLKPSPLVLQFVPGIKGTDSVLAVINYNSAANDLNLLMKNGKIIYNGQQIDSLNFSAKTNNDKLEFATSLQDVKAGSIQVFKTALNGNISNNKLDFNLLVNDKKNNPQYQVGGILDSLSSRMKFSLKKDDLMLDYEKWTIAPDNFIQYDSTGILVNNFKLGKDDQFINISSTSPVLNSPVKVSFNNFHIGTLTKIANQDSLLADGVINGEALVKDITTNPVFTSDIKIENLSYKKDTVGNIIVKVNNEEANTYAANVAINGNGNDIKMDGKYYTGESRMDLKLNIDSFNLATIKPFASAEIQDIKGLLKGNISLAGTLDKPAVNGDIHFQDAYITPAISGERLKLPDDKILIDQDGISFSQFTILDSASNKAIIDGNIYTSDFKKYRFDIDLDAKNFRVVNTPQSAGKLFYGKMNVDSYISVTGDMDSPKVDADLKVNRSTNFTMVLPSSDPEIADREGVVRFVDKDHPLDTAAVKTILDSLSNQSLVTGLDVTANIETDSAALFTIVIDERSGDAISLKGKADLAGGIDKSGKISLTGNYVLQQGSYQLSLSLLKRKFDIQKGSTITWTGDPMSATVDITAVYLANTASIDLVEPQLAGRPQTEINKFKQKLPFQVNLKMAGELLKPTITFDITLPDETLSQWPDVDTKLQQVRSDESELNKQVFALLLLNRFVGENPLQSDAGSAGVAGMVRESASKILTSQLNQLAGSLVKGVDLNFDVNSGQDYSTGEAQNKTDLTVGVSKSLLNDRLRVNVGSNFEVEGPQAGTSNAANIAGDVSVDYQLSKDGRYMLRAYRKNQYESVVEGQVVETGVSFIFTLDYNQFKELFQGKKAEKERQLKNKKTNTGNTIAK